MMTPQQKPPLRIMSVSLTFGKWFGLWHESNLNYPCWQAVLIIFCILFWFIFPGCLYIARQEKTLQILLKPILEVFAMIVIVVRCIYHLIKRMVVQECLQDLQRAIFTFEDCPYEDVRRVVRHLLKSADYLVKFYASVVAIQATAYGLVPAGSTTFRYCTSNETIELPSAVLEADYVVFDHTTSYGRWMIATVISVMVQYCMLGTIAAQECLFWNLLHHVSCLFRIVRLEIARLDLYTDSKQFRERLASIVTTHEVCFRCTRCLENVLYPLLALLYCSCILQTCYIMFVVSVVDDIVLIASMVFVLQYTVFLIFSFSMLGAELMDESARVSDAVYNTHWHLRKPTERRLLLFVLMRSDRPVGITAAKFFYLNRSTFAAAMKTAFSFFTLMQRFLVEK